MANQLNAAMRGPEQFQGEEYQRAMRLLSKLLDGIPPSTATPYGRSGGLASLLNPQAEMDDSGPTYLNPAMGDLYNETTDNQLKDRIEHERHLLRRSAKQRSKAEAAMGKPSPPKKDMTYWWDDKERADKQNQADYELAHAGEIDDLVAGGQQGGYPNLPFHTYPDGIQAGHQPGSEHLPATFFKPPAPGPGIDWNDGREYEMIGGERVETKASSTRAIKRMEKARKEAADFKQLYEKRITRQIAAENRPKTKAQQAKAKRRANRATRQEMSRDRRAGLGPDEVGLIQQQNVQTATMQEQDRMWREATARKEEEAAAAPQDWGQMPQAGGAPGGGGLPELLQSVAGGEGSSYTEMIPGLAGRVANMPISLEPGPAPMPASSQAGLMGMQGVDPAVQVQAMQNQQAQSVMQNANAQMGTIGGFLGGAANGNAASAAGFAPNNPQQAGTALTPIERDDEMRKVAEKRVTTGIKEAKARVTTAMASGDTEEATQDLAAYLSAYTNNPHVAMTIVRDLMGEYQSPGIFETTLSQQRRNAMAWILYEAATTAGISVPKPENAAKPPQYANPIHPMGR